jgi:E3 Ubiquitin ligase
MLGFGLIVIALAIIGIIYGIMMWVKAGRVSAAPLVSTGDAASKGLQVAGPKGAISAQGQVFCQQPLYSPVTNKPCLFYEVKCTATWKEGDRQKTRELDKTRLAADFYLNDGSGPVRIDASAGGDFEPSETKTETKGTGLIAGIAGGDMVFGNYRVQTGMFSLGTKYTVEEKVFPFQQSLYACGKVADQGGTITAPGWRSLILSNKNRDELLAHATKSAKIAVFGGAGGFVVGLVLSIVGSMMASSQAAADAAAAASAAAAQASAGSIEPGAGSAGVPDPGAASAATAAAPKPTAPKPGTTPAKTPAKTAAPAPTPPKKK